MGLGHWVYRPRARRVSPRIPVFTPTPMLSFSLRSFPGRTGIVAPFVLAAAVNATEPAAESATASATPFRLFAGVDLAVTRADASAPVPILGIGPRQFVLGDPARTRLAPGDAGSLSALSAIKVGRAELTVSEVRAVRAFTPRTDPVMQGMIMQNELALHAMDAQATAEKVYLEGEASRANTYRYAAANSQAIAAGERAPFDDMGTIASVNAAHETDLGSVMDAHAQFDRAMRDPLAADLTARGAENEDYDLLDLRFDLTAPTPIRAAYVVVVARIAENGEARLRTFYQHVGDLDAKPRSIVVRHAGFKPGFELKEFEIHVYSRGQELVTNLSPKRTPLTAEQTREFLLLTHLSDHATDSCPARPVWALAPNALLGTAAAAAFDQAVAVNIDADGRLISIHDSVANARTFAADIVDAEHVRTRSTRTAPASFASSVRVSDESVALNQSQSVPPHIVAVLEEMVFLPAVDAGRPVVSTLEVNLASYFP